MGQAASLSRSNKTVLYGLHLEQGAKMGEFSGFDLPLFYPMGLKAEHLHVRKKAGLFDICHMQHAEIRGDKADELLTRLCPIDLTTFHKGQCRYSFLLNDRAGVIDDLIVSKLGDQHYGLVLNAGCAAKDIAHIEEINDDISADFIALERGFLALQGPKSEAALMRLGFTISSLNFMESAQFENDILISRTGYTGEDGFEIALPLDQTLAFAQTLCEDENIALIGLGARDSLRLEAGLSLYGQDLNEDLSPVDCGLLWAIPKLLRQSGSFIGAKALHRSIAQGPIYQRVGFTSTEKAPIRSGASLFDQDDNQVGEVTSGGFGPSFDGPIIMGLVKKDTCTETLFADRRGKRIPLIPHKLPFIPHKFKKRS